MYHFLYKTTNTVTGKIYIGAHSTTDLNDAYLGSGKQIKDAIKKYGKRVFIREILEHFDTRAESFAREAEIVTEDFIKEFNNYNMCPGVLGATIKTVEYRQKVSAKLKGRIFSEEHRKKISLAQSASCSSPILGCIAGGASTSSTINTITIATTGNATSFGNLAEGVYSATGTSNGNGGL